MTRRIISAREDMDIEAAASLMLREGVSRLPVLHDTTLVGIITRADIINAVGSSYAAEGADQE